MAQVPWVGAAMPSKPPIRPQSSQPAAAGNTSAASDEGATERVDALSPPLPGAAAEAGPAAPAALDPGRYLEVQSPNETTLVRLEREATRIGRGLGADLRLEENSVSRRHAVLVSDASGARILDDRSSNGTFLNGERIEQAQLKSGDVISVGRITLRFLEA